MVARLWGLWGVVSGGYWHTTGADLTTTRTPRLARTRLALPTVPLLPFRSRIPTPPAPTATTTSRTWSARTTSRRLPRPKGFRLRYVTRPEPPPPIARRRQPPLSPLAGLLPFLYIAYNIGGLSRVGWDAARALSKGRNLFYLIGFTPTTNSSNKRKIRCIWRLAKKQGYM